MFKNGKDLPSEIKEILSLNKLSQTEINLLFIIENLNDGERGEKIFKSAEENYTKNNLVQLNNKEDGWVEGLLAIKEKEDINKIINALFYKTTLASHNPFSKKYVNILLKRGYFKRTKK